MSQPRRGPIGFGPPGQGASDPKAKVRNSREALKRLAKLLAPERASLVLAGAMVVCSSLLGLAQPWLMGYTIDHHIAKKDLAGLAQVCGLMLVILLTATVMTWLQSWVMIGSAQRTVTRLRRDLFSHVQKLPLARFDSEAHGELMSRCTNDVERLSSLLTDSLGQIVSSSLTTVGVAAAMLTMNPVLALISLGVLGTLSWLVNKQIGPRIRGGFREQQASLGRLNGMIEEAIPGLKVTKAFCREEGQMKDFEELNLSLREASTKAQTLGGLMGPFMNGMGSFGLAVVVGAGGIFVVLGWTTIGIVTAFTSYSRQFSRPLNEIANLYSSIQSALAGAERIFEVLDYSPEPDAGAVCLPEGRGRVEFESVTFSYVPGSPVLKDVTFTAQPGETIALIGRTGAGKTTIVNLLTRFYEIDSGRILIDGVNIKDLSKAHLRHRLGIVLQDSFLFAGSVMENIRYGRLDATDSEVMTAAKMANADTFIHHLPDGFASQLTERGSNLSHGQRQLLSIARAILADPQILVLDEATSSVDTRTERHFQEAMRRLMQGRTSFVIAHRLSTIRDADQILVIDAGEVVEQGEHQELLALGGRYAQMVKTVGSDEIE